MMLTVVHFLKPYTTEMGSKQIKITDTGLPDRISALPSNIIECILDHIPIRDAVATSIISKEWRHKWKRIPNLVFDKEFVQSIIGFRNERELTIPFKYSNIIGKILLLHVGPIHKFVLYIPSFCNDLHLDLVSWMDFISQKEVKELTILARPAPIKLPSYIFNCSELQYLKIQVRGPYLLSYLQPPKDFRGFCNLRYLDLRGILNGTQISNLVSKCPLLARLSINRVADGHTVVIDAPKLLSLRIGCSQGSFLKLNNGHTLIAISLLIGRLDVMKFCDLFDIFGSLPNVRAITLASLPTINDMPQDAPTSLPTTLQNHKRLTLLDIDISSPEFIYFIPCILKSSPNLQKLNLGVREIHESACIREEAALHFLDMQIREPQTLNSLSTVKIKGLFGSKVEIMFIKLILSCTPVLETMYLATENIVDKAKITWMSELLKCKRLSPQAQVMYSRDYDDSSIFNFKTWKA